MSKWEGLLKRGEIWTAELDKPNRPAVIIDRHDLRVIQDQVVLVPFIEWKDCHTHPWLIPVAKSDTNGLWKPKSTLDPFAVLSLEEFFLADHIGHLNPETLEELVRWLGRIVGAIPYEPGPDA